ncbi:hypothetical protein APS14_27440 [Pseudomonas thivervalensis]|nr:hypothetical protein APS14_27440 [Pseudomonas thivervalensis]
MIRYHAVQANTSVGATLFIDTEAGASDLLETAAHRIRAGRDLGFRPDGGSLSKSRNAGLPTAQFLRSAIVVNGTPSLGEVPSGGAEAFCLLLTASELLNSELPSGRNPKWP